MIAAGSLSPDQLADVRDALLHSLSRLERSMRISGQSERALDLEQDTVGRLSRIDAIQNQGLTQNLQDREQLRLASLREALARIDSGSYGSCTACGQRIPFERLLVFPEAKTCAACATA